MFKITKLLILAIFVIGCVFGTAILNIYNTSEAKEICLKYWSTDKVQTTSHGIIYCEHELNKWQAITPSELFEYRKNK